MEELTVRDGQVATTVARLRSENPAAYIVARPSALFGHYLIRVYPEG